MPTSDWTDRRTRTMHLLQVASALRIGSLRCRPLPPSSPPFCALVPVLVSPRIPPFPPAAVPLFLCPKGIMSLSLILRHFGATPPQGGSLSPPFLTTSQVVPSSAVIVRDTPMDLGGGSNTNGTGIGDSRYATNAQPGSVTRSLSLTFSSLPALPLTMNYGSPSQVDEALLSGLEDIRSGNVVPLWSSPSSSHGSVTSSSDSDDASMVDGCRTYGLVGGKEGYDSFEEVAADIQRLGKQQNNCLDEIISLRGEIKLLKAVIARLEGDTVAHEAELTIGRGEPVWCSRETIRGSVHAEAAKRMNGGLTPSPPPSADVGIASSSGSKKVAFEESPDIGFVVVDRKNARGHKANRRRRDPVTGPDATSTSASVPVDVPVVSPPPGRPCIAQLPLPLPLSLCPIQLGQDVRFGRGW